MAEQLITQVRPEDENENAIGLGPKHAANVVPETESRQSRSCWRIFCCSCLGRKPKTTGNGAAPPPISIPQATTAPPLLSAVQSKSPPHPASLPIKKFLLPPLAEEHKGRKTLVLDLDETLVHSSFKPISNADFIIAVELDNIVHRVYVRKRPGVDHFLKAVGEKFEIVVFTASLAKYADPVLDILDVEHVVHARLFREACVQHYGNYVKDLSHLGRSMESCVIIDNSPFSYMFQPDNALPVTSWFNDKNDRQLYDILPLLDEIAGAHDEDVIAILNRHKYALLRSSNLQEEDNRKSS